MSTLDQLKPRQAMAVLLYQYLIMQDEQTKQELLGYYKDSSQSKSLPMEEVFQKFTNKLTPEQIENLGAQRDTFTVELALTSSAKMTDSERKSGRQPKVGWGLKLNRGAEIPVLPEGYTGGDGPLPTVEWVWYDEGRTAYLTPFELMYLAIRPEYAGAFPLVEEGSVLSFEPKLRSLLEPDRLIPTPAFGIRRTPAASVDDRLTKFSGAPMVLNELETVDVGSGLLTIAASYGRSIAGYVGGPRLLSEDTIATSTSGVAHLLNMYVKNNCMWPPKALEILAAPVNDRKEAGKSKRTDFYARVKDEIKNLPEDQRAQLRLHADALNITGLLVTEGHRTSRRVGPNESEVRPRVIGYRVLAYRDVTLLLVPDGYIPGTRPDSLTPVTLKKGQTVDLTEYDLMFTMSQPQFSGYASVDFKPLCCRMSPKMVAVREGKKEVPSPSFSFIRIPDFFPRIPLDYYDEHSLETGRNGWGIKPEFEKRFGTAYNHMGRSVREVSKMQDVVDAIKKILDAHDKQIGSQTNS